MLLAIDCLKERNLENGIVNGTKHEFIDQHYQSVRLNEKMTTYKTTDRNYVLGKNSTNLIVSDTQKEKISLIYFKKEKEYFFFRVKEICSYCYLLTLYRKMSAKECFCNSSIHPYKY